MKTKLFLILILICVPTQVFANVTLNEIYPAPQEGESEWIELYNPDSTAIDISGFIVEDAIGNIVTITEKVIAPLEYYLVEMDRILNNDGDSVLLYDIDHNLIETKAYSGSLAAGKSFAKCPDGLGEWSKVLASPLESNATSCQSVTPTLTPTPPISTSPTSILTPIPTRQVSESPTPFPTVTPIVDIYISEVMINPEVGSNEWIELYNNGDNMALLTDWFIDDVDGSGSSPKKFTLEIPSKQYGVFELSSSIFNNSGDDVRLLDHNMININSFTYSDSTQGKTLGRTTFANDIFCSQEPSKGVENNQCIGITITLTPSPSPTATEGPTPTPTAGISHNPYPLPSTHTSDLARNVMSFEKRHVPYEVEPLKGKEHSVLGVNNKNLSNNQQNNDPLDTSIVSSSLVVTSLNFIYSIIKLVQKIPH